MNPLLGRRPITALATLTYCLLTEGLSLYMLAAWAARRFPAQLALADSETRCTYTELLARTDRRITWLKHELGVHKRSRVALMGRSRIGWVETLLACGRLGAETVLLPAFSGETLPTYDLLLCEKKCLPEGYTGNVAFWDTDPPPTLTRTCRKGLPRVGPVTLLTAGTTRAARPVRHRSAPFALWRTVNGMLKRLKIAPGEPALLPLPLCHGHGLGSLLMSLVIGIPLYLAERATPEYLWQCLTQEKIATLATVPTVLHRLLESPCAAQLPALTRVICGSAPLNPALALQCQKLLGPVLYNLYGSSEAGLMTMATPEDLETAPGTVGRPLPGVSLWVNPLGDVWVKNALAPTGMPTGDTGRFDAQGRLFLEGRSDDVLIIGGRNIAPQALEESICAALSELLECAVVGVPDTELGQAVALYAVPRPEQAELSPEDMHQALEQALPRTLRPVQIRFLESLPRNPAGKVLYRQLRESSTRV